MTEEEAIRRCQAGDKEAFRFLVDTYKHVLYGTACLMTGSRTLAEDHVQDAFVSAWKGIGQFHVGRPLKPWLVRILVNRTLSYRRNNATLPVRLDMDCIQGSTTDGPEAMIENRDQVRQALKVLPEEQRQVVMLRYFAGLSLAETAATLGRREGTVKSQAHRALEKMRDVLTGER